MTTKQRIKEIKKRNEDREVIKLINAKGINPYFKDEYNSFLKNLFFTL